MLTWPEQHERHSKVLSPRLKPTIPGLDLANELKLDAKLYIQHMLSIQAVSKRHAAAEVMEL